MTEQTSMRAFARSISFFNNQKSEIKNKKNAIVVLAWNFFQDIKKNNSKLTDKFVNIKDLE